MAIRLWEILARPTMLGLLLVVAGLMSIAAPASGSGAAFSAAWWSQPFRHPDLASVVMALVVFVVILGAARLWQEISEESFDLFDDARSIGLLLVIAGISMTVVHWYLLMTQVPADRVVVEIGEEIQNYETEISGISVDQMLPIRAQVTSVHSEAAVPKVDMSFSEAGSDEPIRESLALGGGVNVEDVRFTPVGFDTARSSLVGTFRGTGDETISTTAAAGQSFQVSIDGPSYRVEQFVRDYMGALGAAARIAEPTGETYWVFQKQTSEPPGRSASERERIHPDGMKGVQGGVQGSEFTPDLEHAVKLVDLRESPAVVLAVSPVQPLWPLSVGGLIFMCGFGFVVGAASPSDASASEQARRAA